MSKEKGSQSTARLAFDEDGSEPGAEVAGGDSHPRRANDLDGATWTRHSISVWSDIRKNAAELAANHPAMFPAMLVERLIDCFTTHDDRFVLDPFMGSGATLIAAQNRGKIGIGFEI